MLFLIHPEPQFLIKKEMVLSTKKGEYWIEEGTPLGLLKTPDGRLFIGTGEENSDQLEITGKIGASKLLEACQPSNFELALDEEGDSFIRPVLLEQKVTVNEKISRITLTESEVSNPIEVLKIDYI